MRIFFSLLFIAGLLAVVEPFLYLYGKQWYEKNPDAEVNYKFEELKLKFERREWAVWVHLAVGSVMILLAVLIYIKFA